MEVSDFKMTEVKFDADGPLRIDEVKVEWKQDESPDLSFIGEYTNESDPYYIVAVGEHAGEFVVDLPEEAEMPPHGNNYRYFKPYAGGEKLGSAEYRSYGKQDYKRMADYNRDDWFMQGCVAKATVSYPIGQGSRRLEWFTSSGLWGIESDSEKDYLKETEDEQLEDLADHLSKLGVIKVTAEELRAIKEKE